MTFTSGIALLRGINVGRAKRIAMADLRTLFEALGFTNVRTVLNSGNVVFGGATLAPAAAAAAIEEALVQKLGVASRVTVLSAAELDQARLIAYMLSGAGQRKLLETLAEQDWAPGALALGKRAAYVWCPGGVLDSAAAAAVAKLLGDGSTSRNWNTMLKLHALCTQAAGQ
jgi:uncharacterized protein (DUF1697 family)